MRLTRKLAAWLAVVVVGVAVVGLALALPMRVVRARAELEPLRTAREVVALRLNPRALEKPGPGDFHGYAVLGRAAVPEADRALLTAAFERGMRENRGMVAGCFNPRHGLRARAADGTVTDYVICFECYSAVVWVGDRRAQSILTTASPQPEFERVFGRLGLPPSGEPPGS